MANTRTQKTLSLSKAKSENIVDWFVNEVHWNLIADNFDIGKTAVFRYKKQIKELAEVKSPLYALGEIFTLNRLNTVIELFNDHIEHPEKYEKPKTKKEINIEKQAEVVKKHMEEMNMDYLSVEKSEKKEKKEENPTKQQRNKDAQKKQAQQANEVRKKKG
ncbi:hypothetical protein [Staphylococcus pseudintermedius]|uniref:hypothetical protein n=1 Tax=Staphylococcus pseudintermedius TaxID=283734 RepID=UPI00101FDBFE|nr:hypothetical protein [Staphylococcus pseudintermedius]RYS18664.1 hypothetical protein DLS48_11300 [Staphylococcus pseudintermedius]